MDSQELQRIKNKYDIVGNDAALNHAIETALAVAPTDLTVLITGESGAGKDVIPQIIHQHSRRKTGKYLAINCGAIPEGTINSELFGHVKGSFTGAVEDRKGYFEMADGGTLFLDEIGELPKETQAMLLRVLQNGEFIKVGSSKVQKTDVRVIAATNISLRTALQRGQFREDLYYRLNAVQIMVPSLRERPEDIYLLFRKFSSDFAEKNNSRKVSLSHEAISLLKSYRWPGNVRQLKNIAETVTALESSRALPGATDRVELTREQLAPYVPDEQDTLLPMTAPSAPAGGMSDDEKRAFVQALVDLGQKVERLEERVNGLAGSPSSIPAHSEAPQPDEAEWQEQVSPEISLKKASDNLIQKALERHGGNIKEAAAELGISERTIYRKLAKQKEEGK